MISGIVFDLDDTLLESESVVEDTEYKLLIENGAKIPDSERYLFRPLSFPEVTARFLSEDKGILKTLSVERSNRLAKAVNKMRPFPGTARVLKELRKKGLGNIT